MSKASFGISKLRDSAAFSVITICLNEARTIARTCESVIRQTHSDREWIVVDGGSTDGTLEVLKAHQSSMAAFISEPDGGIYHAMNKGIARAAGKYIVFMNGGDVFAADEVLDWVAAGPQTDLICGNIHIDCIGGVVVRPVPFSKQALRCGMIHHQATFFRRDLFHKHGGYDDSYRIRGDYDFFARLAVAGDVSFHHIDRPLAVFHLGGISSAGEWKQVRAWEDHLVRKRHFPGYRWSFRAWRHEVRGWMARFSGGLRHERPQKEGS